MTDVILITKKTEWCQYAGRLARMVFGGQVHWIQGRTGDTFPEDLVQAAPRLLISFLSPWIIPKKILDRCGLAINFHPGSASYPGAGCYNFALYEGAERYGTVCHVMNERIDAGTIIEERTFPVLPDDSVETLKFRTMIMMTAMYMEKLQALARGEGLRAAGIGWTRTAFSTKLLNELCVVTPDMTEEEIRRRVRATTYPGYPGATVSLGGVTFVAPIPNRDPLA